MKENYDFSNATKNPYAKLPTRERPRALAVRPAGASDAEALALLLASLGYPSSAEDMPERVAAVTSEGGAVLLAVDPKGAAVGLVSLARHAVLHAAGPVAYITALVTVPEARGRGVGRSLVDAAERWARERGCVRLSVTSAEHRADAHAFYPRCGLVATGRRYSKALD